MDRECSMHGHEEECTQACGGEKRRKETTTRLDAGGRIILKCLREIGWGGIDWTHLIQDRDQRWTLKCMIINL
jgi:hypothetical protein